MKVLRFLDKHFEEYLLIGMLLLMVICVFIQVVMRYVFNNSLSFSEEVARYLFVWQVWIGASYVAKKSQHLQVDLLRKALKNSGPLYLELAVLCVSIIFCLILLFYAFNHAVNMYGTHRIAVTFPLPMWIVYSVVPLGLTLMVIRFFQNLINIFKKIKQLSSGEVG